MTTAVETRTVVTSLAALRDAVKAVRVGIASRPPVPILGCVLITSGQQGLTMRGYDYRTDITVQVVPEPGPEWTVAVSWAWVNSVVHALGKHGTRKATAALPISLEPHYGIGLRIKGDGWEFNIPGVPHEDFPPVEEIPTSGDHALTVERDALLGVVQRVAVSAGNDDTPPILTGVHFTVAGDHVTIASTDRFRLSVAEMPATTSEHDWTTNIPAKVLLGLLRAIPAGQLVTITRLDETDPRAKHRNLRRHVRIEAGGISAQVETVYYYSGTNGADFVDYRALIPTENNVAIEVNRKALLTAIDRASIAADRGHHLRIDITPDGLRFSAGSADSGKAIGPVIPVVSGNPAEMPIAFNPLYLADGLRQFTGETVALGMTTYARPLMMADTIAGLTDNDAPYRYLVMPARLEG